MSDRRRLIERVGALPEPRPEPTGRGSAPGLGSLTTLRLAPSRESRPPPARERPCGVRQPGRRLAGNSPLRSRRDEPGRWAPDALRRRVESAPSSPITEGSLADPRRRSPPRALPARRAARRGRHGRGVSGPDTKLNRDVAIKVLPDALARIPSGWRASSARRSCSPRSTTPTSPPSTASRSEAASHFLVLELVEGETWPTG